MDLPIEIVEQGGDAPLFLVLAELAGVGRKASFDGQSVLAQALGLRELAQDLPSLFAVISFSGYCTGWG